MKKVIKRICWVLKWIFYLVLVIYAIAILLTVIHVQFNVCPLHFHRFSQNQLRPVIYGFPTEETFQAARHGEVVIGGCVPLPVAAFCPYCWLPARFRPLNEPPAIPLDEKAMNGLSYPEREAVSQYVRDLIAHTQVDANDRITALLVTPTDVWLGTFGSSLHRLQRKTMEWESYAGTSIGYCIKSIRNDGTRIYVKHETMGNGLFWEDYTEDHGKTWKRP